MKKRGLATLVFTLIILCAGLVVGGSADHVADINKAFNCLDSRVDLTSISFEEAVFSALAKTPNQKINQTINQEKSSSEACWPGSVCTVKATSQAILAKMRLGQNVSDAINWLKARSGVTQQMTWYLQITIDSNEPASCLVNYDDVDRTVLIDEDMKLSGNLGSCLAITPSGYRIKIANNCLEKDFGVQCDKDFRTNLLYEKDSGGTIYVSSQTHGASAGAWTNEKIIAKCFKDGGSCDYEGSLWAATAIYANGGEVSEYSPYLKALAENNQKFFPSAFLVAIYQDEGDEHYANIIANQRARPEGAYWQIASSPYSKFYDTALAMLALGGADSPEIDSANTLGYLFTNQDESGCWNQGNIRDTAFLIYAAQWPRSSVPSTGRCGDGTCNPGENSTSCLTDCPLPIYVCGDGVANGAEACDGNDLRGQTCISKNYTGGSLTCVPANKTNQCTYNVSSCTGPAVNPVCGDGVISGNELCDCGADGSCSSAELNGSSCTSVGNYAGGNLGCSPGCLTYNVSMCYSSGGPPPPPGGNGTGNNTNGTGGGGGPYNPNLLTDCELANLFCVPTMWACKDAGGTPLPQETHACQSHVEYCCTVDADDSEALCADLQGTVCPWNAPCSSLTVESKDGPCCVTGTCEEGASGCSSDDDCPAGKVCSLGECVTQISSECNDDEDCDGDETCEEGVCVAGSSGGSNLWLWIVLLLILIVLVVVGIVYRDKLRTWWYQMSGKVKTSKVGTGSSPPGMPISRRPPPRFGPPAGMRPVMGGGPMIRPGVARPAAGAPPAKQERSKEEEETLRKLKEMSK